ncbi:hypothetical protein MCOR25_008234 [Pyricularia grisea]|uniref:Uncharacterized protein n=1 Tax=Pyricularia grisea TaxID=148305 RepID=A0A6P8B1A4_PYRGI|nr:uncharacterized protein PgNI_07961 [Pyricularia grisea]KAI6355348.1 hypothetical protein MCOR25_008234 [Pyricularia grisea]TLD08614.1 hypothetical protein PgNI_07961 [Pyricularia grisea]
MLAVHSYRPEVFTSLPQLHHASERFASLDGDETVEKEFKDLFRRHGMEHTFGLTMLHRHFDMAPNERLVEYGATSTPWELESDKNTIKPHCWVLGQDGVSPYEFRYDPQNNATELEIDFNSPKIQAFAHEFIQLVDKIGGTGLFGICAHPGARQFTNRLEFTEGRANITIPMEEVPEDMKRNMTSAAWYFHNDQLERCSCSTDSSGRHCHS